MPICCAVVGCGKRGIRDGNKFYKIPNIPKKGRSEIINLKTERRQKWIQALKRSDLTASKLKNAFICDRHFLSGKYSFKFVSDWFFVQNVYFCTYTES